MTDATSGTWSSSCSEPWPHRACGARPPTTNIGVPFIHTLVIALTPLVTPGPAVSAATPTRRVTLAQPSAANAARLLVTGVDEPHPFLHAPVVERPEVAAVEREHSVDVVGAQRARAPARPR